MQRIGRLFYGKFNGKFMGSQGCEKPVSTPFLPYRNEKSQQLHFCKLLIFRAETEI